MTQNPNDLWVHLQQISAQDELQLVDKVLACPTMNDRHSRDTAMSLLDQQVASAIQRSPIDKMDVTNIVSTCLKHQGAFGSLIDIVGYYEGDKSLPFRTLTAFLKDIEFFAELKQIAQGIHVSKDVLDGIYLQSVSRSPDWPLPDTKGSDESTTLALMLRELAQHVQKKHIVRFVNQLIPYAPEPAVQQSLGSWLNRAINKFSLNQADLAVLPVAGRSPSLLVKFTPDVYAPELVSIEACFFDGREEDSKVLHTDREPRSYETVPELLKTLIRDCQRLVRDHDHKLTIEVFFSANFLNHNVDQWRFTGLSGKISISRYFPLVVRSLDRIISEDTIEGEIIRKQWRRSWSIFKQRASASFQLCSLSADTSEQKDAEDLLDIPCLALTFAPPAVFDEDRPHIFLKMIDAGIPIAFWPHCTIEQMDEQAIQQMYDTFWSTCDIPELPRLIWEKRSKQTEPLLFRRLVLLWDDPDRIPANWLLEKEA